MQVVPVLRARLFASPQLLEYEVNTFEHLLLHVLTAVYPTPTY